MAPITRSQTQAAKQAQPKNQRMQKSKEDKTFLNMLKVRKTYRRGNLYYREKKQQQQRQQQQARGGKLPSPLPPK